MGKENSNDSLPFQCSIHIGDQRVGIYSKQRVFLPYFCGKDDLEYRYDIPVWNISDQRHESDPKITYLESPDNRFYYNKTKRKLTIKGPLCDYENGQALAYACYWLSEGQRQHNRSFSIHAASLSIQGRGILLIGDKGAGKTSLLLRLAETCPGKLIGNDLSIVSHRPEDKAVMLEGGSKKIRLRLRSVLSNFPYLSRHFPERNGSSWTTKVLVDPRMLNLEVCEEPQALSRAFLVHLSNEPTDPLLVNRVNGIQPYFEIYENLSRIIRGSAISLFGKDDNILGFLPSLETYRTHQNKIDFINHLIKERGLYFVSGGNISQLCEKITELTFTGIPTASERVLEHSLLV